jgi:hypothetical protein
MNGQKWERDSQTGEHQMIVAELNGFYVVMKSVAGDFYAGFQKDDEGGCDEIEYFDTWQQARKWCIGDLKERIKEISTKGEDHGQAN